MSRRVNGSELEFGSDSFLDVITNLVGILIVLILLAALRAQRAPIEAELPAPVADSAPQSLPATDSGSAPIPELADDTSAQEQSRLLGQVADQEARIRQLQQGILEIDPETAELELLRSRERQQQVEADLRRLRASLRQSDSDRQQIAGSMVAEQDELKHLQRRLDELNRQLAALAANAQQKQEKLAHRVTPIGLEVRGKEIHFRIERGKVSVVPLDELADLLKEKIVANRDWLMKYNKHQGQLGPIDGYVMKYEVARENLGLVNELSTNYGLVRISVSQFVIEPRPGVFEQPAAAALQPEGIFYRQLVQAPPESALTIWVYPDSFAEYRQLASFAQKHGFVVAARPLPFGLPITGSSQGSRSVGQ